MLKVFRLLPAFLSSQRAEGMPRDQQAGGREGRTCEFSLSLSHLSLSKTHKKNSPYQLGFTRHVLSLSLSLNTNKSNNNNNKNDLPAHKQLLQPDHNGTRSLPPPHPTPPHRDTRESELRLSYKYFNRRRNKGENNNNKNNPSSPSSPPSWTEPIVSAISLPPLSLSLSLFLPPPLSVLSDSPESQTHKRSSQK